MSWEETKKLFTSLGRDPKLRKATRQAVEKTNKELGGLKRFKDLIKPKDKS